jgi:uncharacterized membrane protein HdeD (DUF308 family)
MTDKTPSPDATFGDLKISWGWLLALGILLAVLGFVGIGMAYWLTLAAVLWFGVLAIIAGIAQLVDAFHYKGWKSILWHVIIAVVYVIAGIVLIAMPVRSAFWLTLFIAISLIVAGVFRAAMAFQMRRETGAWGWVLLSAIISVVLGVLILGTVMPEQAAVDTAEEARAWIGQWGWVIGMFVAIELLVQGLTLISIALAARSFNRKIGSGGGASPSATA